MADDHPPSHSPDAFSLNRQVWIWQILDRINLSASFAVICGGAISIISAFVIVFSALAALGAIENLKWLIGAVLTCIVGLNILAWGMNQSERQAGRLDAVENLASRMSDFKEKSVANSASKCSYNVSVAIILIAIGMYALYTGNLRISFRAGPPLLSGTAAFAAGYAQIVGGLIFLPLVRKLPSHAWMAFLFMFIGLVPLVSMAIFQNL